MKKNIVVRILAALGGVCLWALGLAALAETFFRVPVTEKIGRLLGAGTPVAVLLTLLLAIALCAVGTCCLLMLSTRRAAKRAGFVMQKSENGMIGVSIKSIEGLVQTCVKQHDVVAGADINVVERRDGIVILLNIEEAAGVNIPLAVGALQKQIKQYVNACTGVDVHEVRVMVENTENSAAESPYAVQEPVVAAATAVVMQQEAETPVQEPSVPELTLPADEAQPEPSPVLESPALEAIEAAEEETAAPESIVAVPVPMMPVMPEMVEDEDDRPLHQRLFGAEEQPVFVPAPPELTAELQLEEIAEEAQEMVAETAQEPEAEETQEEMPGDLNANAVLEVVEAIAEEEAFQQEEELSQEDGFEYDEEALAEEALLDGAEDEDIRL